MSIISRSFDGNEVRVTKVNNEVLFVGKDVAEVLGYASPTHAVTNNVWEEYTCVQNIHDGSQTRSMVCITEQGVLQLVLGSKKPEARKFQRWVIEDVLPSINQTGSFSITSQPLTKAQTLLGIVQLQVEQEQKMLALENKTIALETEFKETKDEAFYKYNPRQGEGVYRYCKANFNNISITSMALNQLGCFITREAYQVLSTYIDDQQYGNPVVKAYDVDAIEQAITDLLEKNSLVMYQPIKGKVQLKWHTEFKKMKSKPNAFSSSKAILILFPDQVDPKRKEMTFPPGVTFEDFNL